MRDRYLKDWTALGDAERGLAADRCRAIAAALQDRLAAFIAITDPPQADAGPLNGLPYAAKDMFSAPGRTPTWGLSEPVADLRDGPKAEVLDRLDRAGATCIGFTRMSALAYEPSGINPLQGAPRNPWSLDVVTGASSSGSAVAVASGAAFVALGSDTGGSLRIPAQGCGVTAWKPGWGLVPGTGAMPLAPSLDCIGLLARSARDIKAAAPSLAGSLGADDEGETPHRIAVMADALAEAEPSVRHACTEGLAVFQLLGVELTERDGLALLNETGEAALTVIRAEAARNHKDRLGDPQFDADLARRLGKGLSVDDATLAASLDERQALVRQFLDDVLQDSDMLALPVMPIRTPLVRECDPTLAEFRPRTLYAMSAFTRFVNYLGLPAVAVPVARDNRGLPVALQLIGPPGSDMTLLQTGIAFQEASSWHGRLPPTLASFEDTYGDY